MPLSKQQIQELISQFIEDNEMSLEAFAQYVGNSTRSKVHGWVNGEYSPRPATIDRMIDLGILPDEAGRFRDPEQPAVPASAVRVLDEVIADMDTMHKASMARLKKLRKDLLSAK